VNASSSGRDGSPRWESNPRRSHYEVYSAGFPRTARHHHRRSEAVFGRRRTTPFSSGRAMDARWRRRHDVVGLARRTSGSRRRQRPHSKAHRKVGRVREPEVVRQELRVEPQSQHHVDGVGDDQVVPVSPGVPEEGKNRVALSAPPQQPTERRSRLVSRQLPPSSQRRRTPPASAKKCSGTSREASRGMRARRRAPRAVLATISAPAEASTTMTCPLNDLVRSGSRPASRPR
jgi:hypothetical protein